MATVPHARAATCLMALALVSCLRGGLALFVRPVVLRHRTVQPHTRALAPGAAGGAPRQYWVQLSHRLSDAHLRVHLGCTAVNHKIHGHTFPCLMTAREAEAAAQHAAVAWVGLVHDTDKWDPAAMARAESGVTALLLPSERVDVAAVERRWASLPYRVRRVGRWALRVLDRGVHASSARPRPSTGRGVPVALLARLARAPEVYWLQPFAAPRLHNLFAVPAVFADDSPLAVASGGAGQTVAIADTGLDSAHCAFDGPAPPRTTLTLQHGTVPPPPVALDAGSKLAAYVRYRFDDDEGTESDFSDVAGGHGTHVMATAVGRNGAAPDARLVVLDIGLSDAEGDFLVIPHDIDTHMLEWLHRYTEARIFSVSWGTDSNAYDETARQIDAFVHAHDEFVVVVAGGNAGADGLFTVGAPATSKNAIAVGASFSPAAAFAHYRARADVWGESNGVFPFASVDAVDGDAVAAFSARGPTHDGRIKPDLLAPGSPVASARAATACGVTVRHGTSMSAPLVAGLAARVREAFGTHISAALVKAVLVAWADPPTRVVSLLGQASGHARELHDETPTKWHAGHGVVHMGDPALLVRFDRVRMDAATPVHRWVVEGAHDGVDVVLAWTDPPASPNARRTLQVDLDLDVLLDGGVRLRGNGGALPDTRNNVERVRVPAGAAHRLDVFVRAPASLLGGGAQLFALVVDAPHATGGGAAAVFEVPYDDACVAGTTPPEPCVVPDGSGGGTRACAADTERWAAACALEYCHEDHVWHDGACVAADDLRCDDACVLDHGEGRWCDGATRCVVARCTAGFAPNHDGSACVCTEGAGACASIAAHRPVATPHPPGTAPPPRRRQLFVRGTLVWLLLVAGVLWGWGWACSGHSHRRMKPPPPSPPPAPPPPATAAAPRALTGRIFPRLKKI